MDNLYIAGHLVRICFKVLMMVVLSALFFVYTPVSFYANAECLRLGYPKSYVTIGLERYCSTDGAVVVKLKGAT